MTGRGVLREPLVLVLAGVAGGLVLTWLHHPRAGLYVIGADLVGAALLRLVLRPRDAGLLVVRGRVVDTVVLSALGAAVVAVATVTPFPQPGG